MISKLWIIALVAMVILISAYFYLLNSKEDTRRATTPSQLPPEMSIYGELIDYSQTNDLMIFNIHSDIVNWEVNNTFVEVLANGSSVNLTNGKSYVFYFMGRPQKDGPWEIVTVSENLAKYKEYGRLFHEKDLTIDQMVTSGNDLQPNQVGRAFAISIIPNETAEIMIGLKNKQDGEIPYLISSVKIVDELLWEPSLRDCRRDEKEYREVYEESVHGGESKKVLTRVCSLKPSEQRSDESALSNCQITYDSSEKTLAANFSTLVRFDVLCQEPVSCRTWYLSEIYGNVTRECSLILIGDLNFTDELGNIHEKKNSQLRPLLTVSQKTSSLVEYSKEVSSKEEFYIYVDYKDADGNQIKDAQVELQFNNFGVSGISVLRYDETLSRYTFKWSDFLEWDPGYKKGTYEFTITAIKTGYLTQQETHTFTLQ